MKQFPKISGKDLEGKEYTLPFDLQGEYNIVIVPFLRHQQIVVNYWVAYLEELSKKIPIFEFYEIPTLSLGYSAARFMIDGGMRAGIPDIKTRKRTITVYINKNRFKKQLGIRTEQYISIFLLKNDEIIWEERGDFTKEKGQSLENFLSNLNKK